MGERFETAALGKLETIENKLDLLIDAPFREAKMYLQEGDRARCKEKVINAIANNELNLAAHVLYCLLLIGEEKYDTAVEWFGKVIRRFGAHRPIVPREIVDVFAGYCEKELLTGELRSFSIIGGHDCYPTRVWCSPWNIVTLWEDKHWLSSIFGGPNKYRLLIHGWQGEQAAALEEGQLSLWGITGDYALVGTRYDQPLRIIHLVTGVDLPQKLPSSSAMELFSFEPPVATELKSVAPGSSHRFGPFSISVESHQYETLETGIATQYGGERSYTRKSQAGRIVVRPQETRSSVK